MLLHLRDIFLRICYRWKYIDVVSQLKSSIVLLILVLTACGGSLTDEQRKQMREKMALNKIVRVTEAEIAEAAFSQGRSIIGTLDSLKTDSAKVLSYLRENEGKVRFVRPGMSNARTLEQQLVEAYLADESGSLADNVQEKRNAAGGYDSLLYTKPVTKRLPDGSEELEGIWSIWLTKKELVLTIGKSKED